MHQPSWMNAELETLSATARRSCETEMVPDDERWRQQQHVDREQDGRRDARTMRFRG